MFPEIATSLGLISVYLVRAVAAETASNGLKVNPPTVGSPASRSCGQKIVLPTLAGHASCFILHKGRMPPRFEKRVKGKLESCDLYT